MNFRIKSAVALALALGTTQAFSAGLNNTNVDGTVVQLRFSGATATDNGFKNLLKLTTANGGICSDGSLSLYTKSKTILGFCTANSNAGTGMSGKKIAIQKESNGGSANGIINVANQSTGLQFLTFDAATLLACEGGTVSNKSASGDFAAYTDVTCPAGVSTVTTLAPHVGVSDIDPATFVGLGGVTASHVAKLSSESTVAVTFNPVVSKKLRNALQTAQGLTSGSDALADMPSITTAQARAIFTGSIVDISQLFSVNPSTGLEVAVDATAPTDSTIHVCRRGNTSGTMASFKILFLGEGCSKNSSSISSFLTPDAVYTDAGLTTLATSETSGVTWNTSTAYYDAGGNPITGWSSVQVFAGSGSGDVRSCVNYNSATRYAIGVASTEYNPLDTVTNTSNTDIRYVKIDGAEPTLLAVAQGRYPYFTENTFNRVKTGQTGAISGDQLALYNGVKAQIGKPSVIANINFAWRDGAGTTSDTGRGDLGILDLATSSTPAAQPLGFTTLRTTPVNAQSRFAQSAANNCNMSKLYR